MNEQKKMRYRVTLGIILFILYLLCVAEPLQTEFQLDPQWTIEVDKTPSSAFIDARGAPLIPFRLGNEMGYVTPDGLLVNATAFPYKAVISPHYYATFGANAQNTSYYNIRGEAQGTIRSAGFPWLDDDRLFLFPPGGNSFSQCDLNTGEPLWLYEGYTPVLAFASSPAGVVAGFADGSIAARTPFGEGFTKIVPGGSTYPVVLGADISADGRYVASISGLQRQRFILTELTGIANRVVYHEYFDRESNEPGLVYFSNNDEWVYFAQPGTLTALHCKTNKTHAMPIEGRALRIIESPETNLLFAFSRLRDGYAVYIIEDYSVLVGSFAFSAAHACIAAQGDALYVGKDNTLSKLRITRR
jgi:hypothetical protein